MSGRSLIEYLHPHHLEQRVVAEFPEAGALPVGRLSWHSSYHSSHSTRTFAHDCTTR